MTRRRHVASVPLDTTVRIVTPENIAFSFRLAGPYLRAIAWLIDVVCLIIFFFVTALFLFILGAAIVQVFHVREELIANIMLGIFFVLTAIAFWFGNALCEAFWNGQTFGKSYCGIRVLTVDGLPITKYQALLRNVVRMADLLLGPYIFFFMAGNDRFMRLGDIAAGTFVVQEDRVPSKKDIITFKNEQILEITRIIPPEFVITPELAKSLALYVHRRDALSPARRQEIAAPYVRLLLQKMNLHRDVNPDLFLCALYQLNSSSD